MSAAVPAPEEGDVKVGGAGTAPRPFVPLFEELQKSTHPMAGTAVTLGKVWAHLFGLRYKITQFEKKDGDYTADALKEWRDVLKTLRKDLAPLLADADNVPRHVSTLDKRIKKLRTFLGDLNVTDGLSAQDKYSDSIHELLKQASKKAMVAELEYRMKMVDPDASIGDTSEDEDDNADTEGVDGTDE